MNSELSASGNGKMPGEQKVLVGVDIGGTKTAVVLSRELPQVLARIEFPTLPEQVACVHSTYRILPARSANRTTPRDRHPDAAVSLARLTSASRC